jgi:hypothetical protein
MDDEMKQAEVEMGTTAERARQGVEAAAARAAREQLEKVRPAFVDGAVAMRAFFKWEHLPPALQVVSQPFAAMADVILELPASAERTAGMRKLLEAKDCCVRAAL